MVGTKKSQYEEEIELEKLEDNNNKLKRKGELLNVILLLFSKELGNNKNKREKLEKIVDIKKKLLKIIYNKDLNLGKYKTLTTTVTEETLL